MDKTDERPGGDLGARRLLEAIGAGHLDYYSLADERATEEALRAWPLLAYVVRALGAPQKEADPALRVVVPLEDVEPAPPRDELGGRSDLRSVEPLPPQKDP